MNQLLSRHRLDGMHRLFDDFTRGFEQEFAPSLDVSETPTEWRVRAEIPGVAPEAVEVNVTGNVLTVRGEKKSEDTQDDESWRRTERRYGKFARSIEFPTDIDSAKVEARFKHGILTVTLPKAEASKPKTISVKVE